MYRYLANRQHTLFAAVPIHTKEEVVLYNKLIHSKKEQLLPNRISNIPDFEIFARLWSAYADGAKIHYKTPEPIKLYFNKRAEASVYYNSTLLNEATCKTVQEILNQSEKMNNSISFVSIPTPINHYYNQDELVRLNLGGVTPIYTFFSFFENDVEKQI